MAQPTQMFPNTNESAWILSPDELQDQFDEPTLVRGIFRWHVTTRGTSGGTVPMSFGFSMGVIKSTLRSDPPDLIESPVPLLDGDEDWIWETDIMGRSHLTGTFQLTQLTGDKFGFEDIRTKRKFQVGSGLLWCGYNNLCSETDAYVTFTCRLLFLNN